MTPASNIPVLQNPIPEIDKIENEIERYKLEHRRYWYGMSISKELKNQIHARFTIGYVVESKMCPRHMWDVIVEILY